MSPASEHDPIDIEVGARVRVLRKALGLSQSTLADALGITFQQVQKYERGSNRISTSMLVKIAAKLETTVAALVGEQDGVKPPPGAIESLSRPGALELLRAYEALPTMDARRALIAFVEAMGAAVPRATNPLT